jgi:hypothetical protein
VRVSAIVLGALFFFVKPLPFRIGRGHASRRGRPVLSGIAYEYRYSDLFFSFIFASRQFFFSFFLLHVHIGNVFLHNRTVEYDGINDLCTGYNLSEFSSSFASETNLPSFYGGPDPEEALRWFNKAFIARSLSLGREHFLSCSNLAPFFLVVIFHVVTLPVIFHILDLCSCIQCCPSRAWF